MLCPDLQRPGIGIDQRLCACADDVCALIMCAEDRLWDAAVHLGQLPEVRSRIEEKRTTFEAIPAHDEAARRAASMSLKDARRLLSVHALGFTMALWQVRSVLDRLREMEPDHRVDLRAPIAEMDRDLPDLKLVRDSVAHADERYIRRKGRKPLVRDLSDSGPYVLAGGYLENDRAVVAATGATGRVARVWFEQSSLDAALSAMRAAVRAFPWVPYPHVGR